MDFHVWTNLAIRWEPLPELYPYHPWDWYIYLQFGHFFMVFMEVNIPGNHGSVMGYPKKKSLRKFDLDQCHWHAESSLDAAFYYVGRVGMLDDGVSSSSTF